MLCLIQDVKCVCPCVWVVVLERALDFQIVILSLQTELNIVHFSPEVPHKSRKVVRSTTV